MKKANYTNEQIAFALKQAETGTPVSEAISRMESSEQTFFGRKSFSAETKCRAGLASVNCGAQVARGKEPQAQAAGR